MRSWRSGSATAPNSGSGCTGAGRISGPPAPAAPKWASAQRFRCFCCFCRRLSADCFACPRKSWLPVVWKPAKQRYGSLFCRCFRCFVNCIDAASTKPLGLTRYLTELTVTQTPELVNLTICCLSTVEAGPAVAAASRSDPPLLDHNSLDDGFRLIHPARQQPGDHRTDDWGHPKQPELAD